MRSSARREAVGSPSVAQGRANSELRSVATAGREAGGGCALKIVRKQKARNLIGFAKFITVKFPKMSVFKLAVVTAFCLFGLSVTHLSAQSEAADTLPRVIVLGEYEAAFEQMQLLYDQQLMEACQNDFDKAYEAWVGMLLDMEKHANEIKFSLNGVKMWINVFWDKDGTIKHVAYYLKPNSRNVKPEELAAFFTSFSNRYKLPVTSSKKFSYNGSAAFPMLPQQVSDKGNE